MNIRNKLMLLLTVSALATVLVGFFGIYGLQEESKNIEDIGGNNMPSVLNLMVIKEGLTSSSRGNYAIRLNDPQQLEKSKADIAFGVKIKQDALKRMTDALAAYEPLVSPGEEATHYVEFKESFAKWQPKDAVVTQAGEKTIANISTEAIEAMQAELIDGAAERNKLYKETFDHLDDLVLLNSKSAEDAYKEAQKASERTILLMIASFVVSLLVIVFLGLGTLRSVMRPIEITRKAMQDITDHNDLTKRIDYQSKDEMGVLVVATNSMLEKMQGSMRQIRSSMDQTSHATEALA